MVRPSGVPGSVLKTQIQKQRYAPSEGLSTRDPAWPVPPTAAVLAGSPPEHRTVSMEFPLLPLHLINGRSPRTRTVLKSVFYFGFSSYIAPVGNGVHS